MWLKGKDIDFFDYVLVISKINLLKDRIFDMDIGRI